MEFDVHLLYHIELFSFSLVVSKMDSSLHAIEIHHLSFAYRDRQVLDDIHLTVKKGDFLGIVGPNAGGKSTLLKLILGLLKANKGQIQVCGQKPKKGRAKIGYVPQYPVFSRDFPISVEQTIATGRFTRLFQRFTAQDQVIIDKVMTTTEVTEFKHRAIGTLSGGQLQRVLLARALACEPQVLILDEPTANIDMRMETDIFDLLKQLNQKMTILVVSHDIGFISKYVNQVACVNKTLICHETACINGQVIDDLYAQHVHMVDHVH